MISAPRRCSKLSKKMQACCLRPREDGKRVELILCTSITTPSESIFLKQRSGLSGFFAVLHFLHCAVYLCCCDVGNILWPEVVLLEMFYSFNRSQRRHSCLCG